MTRHLSISFKKLFAIILATVFLFQTNAAYANSNRDRYDAIARFNFQHSNRERSSRNLQQLRWSSCLSRIARANSYAYSKRPGFATSDWLGHPTNWNNSNSCYQKYNFFVASENISRQNSRNNTGRDHVNQLMNSDGHRRSLLNSEITHIGIYCRSLSIPRLHTECIQIKGIRNS